jgi:hypothetical protein
MLNVGASHERQALVGNRTSVDAMGPPHVSPHGLAREESLRSSANLARSPTGAPTQHVDHGRRVLLFFAGLAIVSNVVPNETTTWWTTSIFVGFAILSAPIVVDYFMANHQVSEDGLAYRKLVGTRKYLRWSDLRDVRYASLMKWFRLETRSGDVARISIMLMGLSEFARLLLENAPDDAIESGTLHILQATAQGHPPSLWS